MTQQQNNFIDHKLLRKYSVIAPDPADFSFPKSYPELVKRIEMNNQDYPSLFGTGFSKLSPLEQFVNSDQFKITMKSTGFDEGMLKHFMLIAANRLVSSKEEYFQHDENAIRFSLYAKGQLHKCFESTMVQAYQFVMQLGRLTKIG